MLAEVENFVDPADVGCLLHLGGLRYWIVGLEESAEGRCLLHQDHICFLLTGIVEGLHSSNLIGNVEVEPVMQLKYP